MKFNIIYKNATKHNKNKNCNDMLVRSDDMEPGEFMDLISNEEIIVYEDVQASKIWVNYKNGKWIIRPKNLTQNPINLVDLAVQKFYKYAYSYLLSLPEDVTNIIKSNLYFCFEYFPDKQPANIKYSKIPKNNLILTSICRNKKHYTSDIDKLRTYGKLFNVETLPLIYKGKLNTNQLKHINQFLHTDKKDLELFFDEKDFSEFFYNILNPNENNSYLTDGFNDNLQKIIIRFIKSDKEYTCEILNPLYQKMNLKTDSDYSDVYSILLFNFLQFILTINLDDLEIKGNTRELIYINLISKLFNVYLQKNKKDIIGFNFTTPDFFNSDKFKININFISNETTKNYINSHSKLEYLFKIILSSFQKEQKKTVGIIKEDTLIHLNEMIRKLGIIIEQQFNYNTKINRFTNQLQNLDDYKNISWEEDRKGYVYPEIDSILKKYSGGNKKKYKKK